MTRFLGGCLSGASAACGRRGRLSVVFLACSGLGVRLSYRAIEEAAGRFLKIAWSCLYVVVGGILEKFSASGELGRC